MKLALLTILTMIAFAANSVLNRMGLVSAGMDPISFGSIRLFAGAATLAGLCVMYRGGLNLGGPYRVVGVFSLLLYIYGFSLAYVALDTGLGALLLFGTVQVTMFAGALWTKEPVPLLRWLGAGLAFAGLILLLLPVGMQVATPVASGAMMVLAGLGWGVYSLVGRVSADALGTTTANFVLATPLAAMMALGYVVVLSEASLTVQGIALAILSGAVTSGLGYALWYTILPKLGAGRAAVAQSSVPVLALLGGILFLAETPNLRTLIAGVIVLSGIGLSLRAK
jgi:drug/metabolite transporter (DMT)-like permease